MTAYDLASRGFYDFTRLQGVLDQEAVSRDPLSGVLDGVNRTFHTAYYPILTSGSLAVYVDGVAVAGSADYNTGRVVLGAVPASQPVADYTFTPYTANQILQFTILGFMEMEGTRWSRGWQLLDSAGAWADENSDHVYVVDSAGADPTCGSILFSQSRAQINLLMLCCEYRFLSLSYRKSARTDFMWRESVRGMTVDKSKVAGNINEAFDDLELQLQRGLQQAEIQSYPDGSHFGGAILNPATLDYVGSYEWQTAAKLNGNLSLEGFNVSYRPLTFFS